MATNKVDIKVKDGGLAITAIRYIAGTLHAASGTADPKPKKENDAGTHWKLEVESGHSGKDDYATAFNRECGGYNHEYVARSWGIHSEPDQLNFCFAVEIGFAFAGGTAVSAVVWFGQGNSGARHNWWIGGYQSIATSGDDALVLAATEGATILMNLSGGVSDFTFTWKAKTKQIDLPNWMAKIADATSLARLSIPGTHDTCALHGGDAAETQKRRLPEQLEGGIRFLDIRCHHKNDRFQIHHGVVNQKINFGEVLELCLAFLNGHDREALVMSIKEEHKPENNTRTFEQTFAWYLKEFNCADRWYLSDTVPTLGAVRGKIVLFRRFPSEKVSGLKAQPWPDDQTFMIENAATMKVQDQWKVADLGNRKDKWEAVLKLLDEARASGNSWLYVNFGSGAGAFSYPYSTANYVNPRLTNYFAAQATGRFGCVLMDFETFELNRLIVGTNP
jgi:1-phosphatidylinositol phosphodiesterase